jgi:hypothetical protein
MSDITWEQPFCGEGVNCFRLGTDTDGNAYIAVAGAEDHFLRDKHDAPTALIRGIKVGTADHLLI